MVLRIGFVFLGLGLLFACGNKNGKGRFIADTDTAFNQDIRDASKKINADPKNANLYYLRGNTFYFQDKYKDAVLDFQTAVDLDSMSAMYHYRLGETQLKLDTVDSKKARMHLLKAVQIEPKLTDAKLALAKLMLARQEYASAETLLKTMTDQQDFADKAFLYLGISKREQKDTQTALVYFDKSLQLNPKNYDAAMQIALIKSAENDPKAKDYFDRVLAINEYSDEAWYAMGLYFQQKEKYKDALACYDKASTINGGHRLSRYNSAVIYSIFEEWERAEEWCNKTLDVDPENANALALRGFTFENRNNKKAAIADYKAALKKDPKNAPALKGLNALGVKP